MMQMNNPTNPIFQLSQRMNMLTQANAQAKQFQQMFQAKTLEEKQMFVENMCAERGTTVEDFARSLGITIPSNR